VEPAQVEFELSFFPLMLILYMISPWVSFNGNQTPTKWGKHRWIFPPGRYRVEAWYPYIFGPTSPASMMIDFAPGALYRFRYRPSIFWFLDGKLELVSPPLLPQRTQ
jgi:hypothetical protein